MDKEQLKSTIAVRRIYQPDGLELREDDKEKAPTIHGVAIVADVETVIYEGNSYREVESVAPSCITPEFIATQDIKLNLLHERELSFGRNNVGKGMLAFDFSKKNELGFSHPVDSDIAQRAQALIANGTYTGCSFEFRAKDYEISERKGADGKTEYVVRHTAFDRIGAVTIGMDPAYKQTSVGLRELYREQHPDEQPTTDEDAQREAQLKAAAGKNTEKTRERNLRELQDIQNDMDFFDLVNV